MRIKGKFLLRLAVLLCALLTVLSTFAGCVNSPCKHHYTDGECVKCGADCAHTEFEDGKCKVCGMACAHTEYENGKCKFCGTDCAHTEYENGKCKVCGMECAHTEYENGKCKVCGTDCAHTEYENGKCKVCGQENPQTKYSYVPHISEQLPRITVTSDTFRADATREVYYYDGNNAENNIDWKYHNCTVTVSNCEEDYALSATAGIKVRGNWTTTYPKKPFRIKFDKKQAMLGLNGGAKCKSWVLLADYKDCSMERNSLAYYLGNQILGSDGYYCTDFRNVELYINNEYWGMYLLAEQQQINSNRVDIFEADDGYTGTDIGYFLEYDGYYKLEAENEKFTLDYSSLGSLKKADGSNAWLYQNGFTIKSDIYSAEQTKFIKNYTYNVYKICYDAVYKNKYYTFNSSYTGLVEYKPQTADKVYETVSKAVDIQSLVDTYILNEVVCDYDVDWSSFLMSVDMSASGDKKLRFQAPWDFDSAFALRDKMESGRGLFAGNSANPWLVVFVNQGWFKNMVKEKWREIYAAGVQEKSLQLIRTLETTYASYYSKNFNKWGFVISGEAVQKLQNSKTQKAWSDYLYNWLKTRYAYLNGIWL